MSLPVHVFIHILLALLAGFFVWRLWHKPLLSFGAALLGGVFIDIDHLFDYFLAYGWYFDTFAFFTGEYFSRNEKIYVLFHGWEYVILAVLAGLFSREKMLKTGLFALALGIFFHLATDVVINHGLRWQSYSLSYRVFHGFQIEKIVLPERSPEGFKEKETENSIR